MRRMRQLTLVALLPLSTSECTLYGWGWNQFGQIGDGTTFDRTNPTPVARNPGWRAVDAGQVHSCGVGAEARLYCWGANSNGELGDGTTTGRLVPTAVGTASDWKSVSAGTRQTCGIRGAGDLYCWGDNDLGQVGNGTASPWVAVPTRVGTASGWKSVSAGFGHTCGIRGAGDLYCWGLNDHGQLGDGTGTNRLVPTRVGTASDWTTVSAGVHYSCGIRSVGLLTCWGENDVGQLGDGTTTDRLVPTTVRLFCAGPTFCSDWTAASTGIATLAAQTCGIRNAGELYCWGANNDGQLGDGTTTDRVLPTRVGAASDWTAISAGYEYTCGIRDPDGTAPGDTYCWGDNTAGGLGDGTFTSRSTPTLVPFTDWDAVSAGGGHTLGLRRIQIDS